MKHGQEKSDLFIIALKPTNKPGLPGAELVEPRERTKGNMGEQHTYRTLCRINLQGARQGKVVSRAILNLHLPDQLAEPIWRYFEG
jgi:hypothetical protein